MDIVPESVERVNARVRAARLQNVRVVIGEALDAKIGNGGFDLVMLFGIIPSPMVPR